MSKGPNGERRPADLNKRAFAIVQIASGELTETLPMLRMGCRRFTRVTNGFSKKIENHAHAVALRMMFNNFGRVHKTLRVTPAMQAGIADHIWSPEEIAALAG